MEDTENIIPRLYELLAQRCEQTGQTVKDAGGLWVWDIGDTWTVIANGTRETATWEREGTSGATVPPYHCAVICRGWFAACFSPAGGECFGENTWEELIAAMRGGLDRPARGAGDTAND